MKGVVVAPQPMATEIGARMLERGGNAFDAAVAAAVAQIVFDPFMCGLGGWGSATVYDARCGRTESIGFWPTIGERMYPEIWVNDVRGFTDIWHFALFDDFRNMLGYQAIMTPGTVAGLGELHRRYCTRSWAELLQPAIEWSEQGYPVPEYVAAVLRESSIQGLPHPRLRAQCTPGIRALWQKADGELRGRGDHYSNPDQARTLERLVRHGPEDFYRGELADEIARDFEENDAFVTRADLERYQVRRESPIQGIYRDCDVHSPPLPGGGLLLQQMLNVLECFDLSSLEHNGPDHAYIIAATLSWAGVTRFRHLADPRFWDVPVEQLLSREHAADIAARIRRRELPDHKTLDAPGHTTHLCAADEQGNCVTITHTLTTCSGVVVPGTGTYWNDCVALMDPIPGRPNSYVPGKARASAISPTIIFRDGRPCMVVGAPGGWSITSAVVQAIVNIVDFGMSPTEAVSAPRFHSEGQPVFCELRIPQATVEALQSRGMQVEQQFFNYAPSFARVQCIVIDQGGFDAASDPRRDGGTATFSR